MLRVTLSAGRFRSCQLSDRLEVGMNNSGTKTITVSNCSQKKTKQGDSPPLQPVPPHFHVTAAPHVATCSSHSEHWKHLTTPAEEACDTSREESCSRPYRAQPDNQQGRGGLMCTFAFKLFQLKKKDWNLSCGVNYCESADIMLTLLCGRSNRRREKFCQPASRSF